MRTVPVLSGLVVLLVGLFLSYPTKVHGPTSSQPVAQPVAETASTAAAVPSVPVVATKTTSVLYAAPFTSQSPKKHWDSWHEEMCEEASLLIASAWYHHDTQSTIPPDQAEKALSDMAAWERANQGTDTSTTIDQVAAVARSYLQIPSDHISVVTVQSTDQLVDLVRSGVVIAPFAGQFLHNPHFTGVGPRYHMSVLIGFDEHDFVVHDVGTQYGADYRYSQEVIWQALHDFVPLSADISTGAKRVLTLLTPYR